MESEARSALPPEFICPACAYDLSGAASALCPECGRAVDERDIEEFRRRDAYVRGHAGAWMLHGHVAAVAVVVMSAGAAVVMRAPVSGFLTAVLTTTAFAAPALLAWGIARFVRPHLRAAYLTVWARSSWLLHAPWLVIPVCTVIAFVSAWIDSMLDSMMLAVVAGLGFGFWGLGALSCLLGWFEAWHHLRRELGLRDRVPLIAYGFLALITFCGSAALAFAGGGAAVMGAEEWFR